MLAKKAGPFLTSRSLNVLMNHHKLLFVSKEGNTWEQEIIADSDDGYYGTDGRRYTGGLIHLVFDKNNIPHIIFSDIASSHAGMNYFNLGNIRYAVKEVDEWKISKIYEQPLPNGFTNATEMYGMCLLISNEIDKIQIIGQEIKVASDEYDMSFVNFIVQEATVNIIEPTIKNDYNFMAYPNPFKSGIYFSFNFETNAQIKLQIYNINNQLITTLYNEYVTKGNKIWKWDGKDNSGQVIPDGLYIARLSVNGQITETIKTILQHANRCKS